MIAELFKHIGEEGTFTIRFEPPLEYDVAEGEEFFAEENGKKVRVRAVAPAFKGDTELEVVAFLIN